MKHCIILVLIAFFAVAHSISAHEFVGAWTGTAQNIHSGSKYNVEFFLWEDGQYACHSLNAGHSCFFGTDDESPSKIFKIEEPQLNRAQIDVLDYAHEKTSRDELVIAKNVEGPDSVMFSYTQKGSKSADISFKLKRNTHFKNKPLRMCGDYCGHTDKCNFETVKCLHYCPVRAAIAKNMTAMKIIQRQYSGIYLPNKDIRSMNISTVGMDASRFPGYSKTDYCLRVISYSTKHQPFEFFNNALVIYGTEYKRETPTHVSLLIWFIPCLGVFLLVTCIAFAIRIRRQRQAKRKVAVELPQYNYFELPQGVPMQPQFFMIPPPYVQYAPVHPVSE